MVMCMAVGRAGTSNFAICHAQGNLLIVRRSGFLLEFINQFDH